MLVKKLAPAFFTIILALILLAPPNDPDFGWHYKYGEYIFTNHKILKDNIFSYTMANYKWSNSYWLSQLIVYALYSNLGDIYGNLVLNIVLVCLIFFVIFKDTTTLSKAVLAIILTFLIKFFGVNVRPMYFSTIFLFLLIHTLLYDKKGVRYLPVIFIFWANFHADFMLGLGIFSLYTVQQIYDLWQKRLLNITNGLKTLLPILLSILGTLINPYTFSLWKTLYIELQSHSLQAGAISEFRPYTISDPTGEIVAIYTIVTLGIGLVYFRRKNIPPWLIFAFIIFFILEAKSIYFLRIFIIIITFPLLETVSEITFDLTITNNHRMLLYAKNLYIFCLTLAVTLYAASSLNDAYSSSKWKKSPRCPIDAINFVKAHPPSGNMLNSYNWGGCLIKNLPEYKTFIDGRMPSWKVDNYSIFEDYRKININPNRNNKKLMSYLDQYSIGWLIQSKDYADNKDIYNKLTNYLIKEYSWQIIYEDDMSVIAVKPK